MVFKQASQVQNKLLSHCTWMGLAGRGRKNSVVEIFSLAFAGGETLSSPKDIVVDVQISVLSVFLSKTSSGINTSFTFSMKSPLIIFYYYYFSQENNPANVFRNLRPSHISATSSFGHCHSHLQPPATQSHSELTLGCLWQADTTQLPRVLLTLVILAFPPAPFPYPQPSTFSSCLTVTVLQQHPELHTVMLRKSHEQNVFM